MRQIRGVAQHYAWGDPTAIPHILGRSADGLPWAEWWLGTHPAAPAHLDGGATLASVATFVCKALMCSGGLALGASVAGGCAVT